MYQTNATALTSALNALQGRYREALRVKTDAANCLNLFDSLRPEASSVFLDGMQQYLLCLRGTVPVYYNDNVYNFPVVLIVADGYPYKPPVFRVTPTGKLKIKPQHRHVDDTGLIYHPYLSSWNPAQSTLAELVVQVTMEFGKEPPLYEAQDNVPPPSMGFHRVPPPPPVSNGGRNGGVPPPPYQTQVPPPVYQQKTPPPPPISSVPKPPVPLNGSGSSLRVPAPPISSSGGSSSQITPSVSVLKGRLIDKLKIRCGMTFPKIQKELAVNFELAEKLDKSGDVLQARLKQTKALESDLVLHLDMVKTRSDGLQGWINEAGVQVEAMKSRMDDYVIPADAASKQLLTCVAETLAIDDILYHLKSAIVQQKIDLKTFLKQVRMLSREQFFKQALAQKLYQLQPGMEVNAPSSPALRPKPAGKGTASGHYPSVPHNFGNGGPPPYYQ